MKIYRFSKFGTLMQQEAIQGRTVRGGEVYHVTKAANIVWWWPVNWAYVLIAFPITCCIELSYRNKK